MHFCYLLVRLGYKNKIKKKYSMKALISDTTSLIQCLKKKKRTNVWNFLLFSFISFFFFTIFILIEKFDFHFLQYHWIFANAQLDNFFIYGLHIVDKGQKKNEKKIAISKLCNFLFDFLEIFLKGNNQIFLFFIYSYIFSRRVPLSYFFFCSQNIYNARNARVDLNLHCLDFTDEQSSWKRQRKRTFLRCFFEE